MVRRHGWQLPAHTFQVIAITVFFLLVVAFYAFFAPFVGKGVVQYVVIGIYSPVALAVFILYVRCTSINPADPGIMSKFDDGFIDVSASTAGLEGMNLPAKADGATGTNSPASACRSSIDGHSDHKGSARGDSNINLSTDPQRKHSTCSCFGGLICALFVKEDCRKPEDIEQAHREEALFCTLCNAEVRKFSKHCRSCDKCVDGFDHHCRWLNNCVGRKNYYSFIALMATSLLWLAIEFGVGVAVVVLCFVNRKSTDISIKETLGNGFTIAPFVTVVIICTLLSLVACIPLGELFFFHMILIKKGITTYEYVVAMRAMSEASAPSVDEEGGEDIIDSPTNSAITGISGGSSLSIHYKGSWCTPPRVFIDQADEVIPHLQPGMVPSTVDPDSAGYAEKANKSKKPVKISAWKLAKLDTNEAVKAAAKARASSSVLRPIDARRANDDLSSNDNASIKSSASIDYSATKESRGEIKLSSIPNSYPQSIASQDDYETGTQRSVSSSGSPVHMHKLTTHTHAQFHLPRSPLQPARPPHVIPRTPPVPPATQVMNSMFQPATSYARENRRASVVWDQEAGRYVSMAATATARSAMGAELLARTPRVSVTNPGGEQSNLERRPAAPTNAASSSVTPAVQQQPERLMYTGQSIFFGGPLVSASSNANAQRSEGSRLEAERRDPQVRWERGRLDSLPVFNPGSFQGNPSFNNTNK